MDIKKRPALFIFIIVINLLSLQFSVIKSYAQENERSYYMGFTPFPWDMTLEAVNSTSQFISQYGDIVSHHLDAGVPWVEALDGKPYHNNLANDWENRRNVSKGKKVFVSVTPLNGGRNDIALYRGKDENMPLPDAFKGKSLDDSIIKRAYLNYCRSAIEFFSPDYFAIGIEVNELIHNTPAMWTQFVELYKYVYADLKKSHPDLPIFATFSLHNLTNYGWSDLKDVQDKTRDFLQYVDMVGISYYPFMASQSYKPTEIFDWLRDFTDKQIAISETGYPSEDIILKSFNLVLPGSPESQKIFYETLLERAEQDNYVFVVSFLYRDYDKLWDKIKSSVPEFFVIWKDCGLLDEDGKEKIVFAIWKTYFSKNMR